MPGLLGQSQIPLMQSLLTGLVPQQQPDSFTYRYHNDTIDSGRALRNEDGTVTTVRTVGVPYEGKIYNVPSYDRDTGRVIESEDELLKRFLPNIIAGEVQGFDMQFDGPIEDHPANRAARDEHHLIERDEKRARDAVFYGK